MKMRSLFAVSVLFVLVASSCSKEAIQNADIPKAENAVQVEQELLGIVNTHRNSLGIPALEFSAVAYEHANSHTDYMISKGSLNHDNFSARATSISSATAAEYVAENVAKILIRPQLPSKIGWQVLIIAKRWKVISHIQR